MKTLHKLGTILIGSLLISSTVSSRKVLATDCPDGSESIAKVELFFGLDIPGGGMVKPEAWTTFVEEQVTPKFPDGLTIYEVLGQWQDATTGQTIQESSRVLMMLYEPSLENETNIEAIRSTYKQQFYQDSVMRLDESVCVSF